MKNGGGHFAPELGGHFELELGGQYHWNLQLINQARSFCSPNSSRTATP